MNKIVIGIFAHPDDEAFGPGGTLALHTQAKTPTYVITATDGCLGGKNKTITKIRKKEMDTATKILDLTGHYNLGFKDGSLCNDLYHEILEELIKTIKTITKGEDTSVEFITFERMGITGHLDHIAVSMITSYLVQHIDEHLPNIKKHSLHYFCLSKTQQPDPIKDYFIYCPCGCPDGDIDIVKDVSSVLTIKKAAIKAHESQNPQYILDQGDNNLSIENFIVFKSER